MGSLRYFKRCGGAHLHQRAAAPLPRVQLTAGGARRTAAGVVTLHIPQHAPLHGPLLGEPGQALEPRGGAGLGAGGCAGVAGVANGAAVFPVSTAHRLGGVRSHSAADGGENHLQFYIMGILRFYPK